MIAESKFLTSDYFVAGFARSDVIFENSTEYLQSSQTSQYRIQGTSGYIRLDIDEYPFSK